MTSSIFRQFAREWCADGCGRRIMVTRWHHANGHVCYACWIIALERAEHDAEQRSLLRYTDEERERI